MKKARFALLLTLLLPFAAAAEEEITWNRDAVTHWHDGSKEQRLDEAAHVMDDILCTVCGSEIWHWDDGTAEVYNYNDLSEPERFTSYDENGAVTADYVYLRELNEQGLTVYMAVYDRNFLVETVSYDINAAGESIPLRQQNYDPDGSGGVLEFDSWGRIIRSYTYDPLGNVIFEELTEYTCDDEGHALSWTVHGAFAGGSGYRQVFNQYGDDVENVFYASDGSIELYTRHEYEYTPDGQMLRKLTCSASAPVSESRYAFCPEEDRYYEQYWIEYDADGACTVYEYDAQGNEISVTRKDAPSHQE